LCGSERSEFERSLNGFNLVRCRPCGFVFVNPRDADSALAEDYDERDCHALIRLYDRAATPTVLAGYHGTLDELERLVPGRGRLLDLGCAAGYFFEQAGKRGWQAYGSDIGKWTAEAARARGLTNLYVGRLTDLEFPAGHFDVVHAGAIFEHLTDLRSELAEIRRILRPDGVLHLEVPNYRTLPILLGRDDFMLNMPPQHINYFTPKTLHTLLTSAGFDQVRVSSTGGLKWENLIGRTIRSDIASSYGLSDYALGNGHGVNGRSSGLPLVRFAKSALKSAVIRPVFYNWLKVGISLVGLARRR
jgi:SAM-dependent methyltransferase